MYNNVKYEQLDFGELIIVLCNYLQFSLGLWLFCLLLFSFFFWGIISLEENVLDEIPELVSSAK